MSLTGAFEKGPKSQSGTVAKTYPFLGVYNKKDHKFRKTTNEKHTLCIGNMPKIHP